MHVADVEDREPVEQIGQGCEAQDGFLDLHARGVGAGAPVQPDRFEHAANELRRGVQIPGAERREPAAGHALFVVDFEPQPLVCVRGAEAAIELVQDFRFRAHQSLADRFLAGREFGGAEGWPAITAGVRRVVQKC